MKVYRGLHRRHNREQDIQSNEIRVFVKDDNGTEQPLHHLVLHSPTGFAWGYFGSGPADLALAILADHFGERPNKHDLEHGLCRCWHLHQQFKDEVIAKQPMQYDLLLRTSDIDLFLARHAERVAEIDDMLKIRRAAGVIDLTEPAEA